MPEQGIIAGDNNDAPEAMVLSKERWEEVRRLHGEERLKVSEISRRLDIDRKTVRKALMGEWKPYERGARSEGLLTEHEAYLRERAAAGGLLGADSLPGAAGESRFKGSYETVKRFVRPLRGWRRSSGCAARFETAPGGQSQIDWGEARAYL